MANYLYSPYEVYIWNALLTYFKGNAYSVAGAMGWMRGESNLYPYVCETDSGSYTASKTITQRFDRLGTQERGEFSGNYNGSWLSQSTLSYYWSYNGRSYGGQYGYPDRGYPARGGYGLAQWTETGLNSRKSRMMAYWKALYNAGFRISIGSADFQCRYIEYEMTKFYPSVYRNVSQAKSVQAAMTAYGYYEAGNSPKWIAEIVSARLQWGINLYNKYSGGTPIDPIDPQPPVPIDTGGSMPLWMMIDYNR